ncbi:hypothetical protein D3C74_337720 [compost metagenome]
MRPGTVEGSPSRYAARAGSLSRSRTSRASRTWVGVRRGRCRRTSPTTDWAATIASRTAASVGGSPVMRQITVPASAPTSLTRSTVSPASRRGASVPSEAPASVAVSCATERGVKSPESARRSVAWSSPSMLSRTDGPSTGVHRSEGAPGPTLEKCSVSSSTSRAVAASFTTTPSPGTRTTGPRRASARNAG